MSGVDLLLTTLASSTVLAACSFVAGFLLKPFYEKWLQHQLDRSLEAYKAEQRQKEEKLKAGLQSQHNQIEALQRGALSGMVARNTSLDQRRLEAIEKIWDAVVYLRAFETVILSTFAGLDLKEVAEAIKRHGGVGDWIDTMFKTVGADQLSTNSGPLYMIDRQQLFVPQIVWAFFEAYRAVVLYPVGPLTAIRRGMDPEGLMDDKRVHSVITAALPRAESTLKQYGLLSFPPLAEKLREKLCAALIEGLDSPTSDERSVDQAAAILRAAAKVMSTTSARPLPSEVSQAATGAEIPILSK